MLAVEDEQAIATIEGLAEIAKAQLHAALDGTAPGVAARLREALMNGWVDGTGYWNRTLEVGCPLGWIAFAEGAECPSEMASCRAAGTTYAFEEWAEPIRTEDFPDHTQGEDTGPFRAAVLVSWIDGRLAGQVVV